MGCSSSLHWDASRHRGSASLSSSQCMCHRLPAETQLLLSPHLLLQAANKQQQQQQRDDVVMVAVLPLAASSSSGLDEMDTDEHSATEGNDILCSQRRTEPHALRHVRRFAETHLLDTVCRHEGRQWIADYLAKRRACADHKSTISALSQNQGQRRLTSEWPSLLNRNPVNPKIVTVLGVDGSADFSSSSSLQPARVILSMPHSLSCGDESGNSLHLIGERGSTQQPLQHSTSHALSNSGGRSSNPLMAPLHVSTALGSSSLGDGASLRSDATPRSAVSVATSSDQRQPFHVPLIALAHLELLYVAAQALAECNMWSAAREQLVFLRTCCRVLLLDGFQLDTSVVEREVRQELRPVQRTTVGSSATSSSVGSAASRHSDRSTSLLSRLSSACSSTFHGWRSSRNLFAGTETARRLILLWEAGTLCLARLALSQCWYLDGASRPDSIVAAAATGSPQTLRPSRSVHQVISRSAAAGPAGVTSRLMASELVEEALMLTLAVRFVHEGHTPLQEQMATMQQVVRMRDVALLANRRRYAAEVSEQWSNNKNSASPPRQTTHPQQARVQPQVREEGTLAASVKFIAWAAPRIVPKQPLGPGPLPRGGNGNKPLMLRNAPSTAVFFGESVRRGSTTVAPSSAPSRLKSLTAPNGDVEIDVEGDDDGGASDEDTASSDAASRSSNGTTSSRFESSVTSPFETLPQVILDATCLSQRHGSMLIVEELCCGADRLEALYTKEVSAASLVHHSTAKDGILPPMSEIKSTLEQTFAARLRIDVDMLYSQVLCTMVCSSTSVLDRVVSHDGHDAYGDDDSDLSNSDLFQRQQQRTMEPFPISSLMQRPYFSRIFAAQHSDSTPSTEQQGSEANDNSNPVSGGGKVRINIAEATAITARCAVHSAQKALGATTSLFPLNADERRQLIRYVRSMKAFAGSVLSNCFEAAVALRSQPTPPSKSQGTTTNHVYEWELDFHPALSSSVDSNGHTNLPPSPAASSRTHAGATHDTTSATTAELESIDAASSAGTPLHRNIIVNPRNVGMVRGVQRPSGVAAASQQLGSSHPTVRTVASRPAGPDTEGDVLVPELSRLMTPQQLQCMTLDDV